MIPVTRVLVIVTLFLAVPFRLAGQDRAPSPDERELRRLHAEIIRAHLESDLDGWMAMEADTLLSVNGGRVTFPGRGERRAERAAYLASTAFDAYRDLRDPVVRVSADGTLAWLAAEVEIRGARHGPGGRSDPFRDVWAWVELYERTETGWRLAGIASNRR